MKKTAIARKLLSIITIVGVLASGFSFGVSAEEYEIAPINGVMVNMREYTSHGITVTAPLNVPDYIMDELILENPDTDNIIIYEYGCGDGSKPNSNAEVNVRATERFTNVVKNVTDYSFLARDVFVTSVAKGQISTISQGWSYTLSNSVTGELPLAKLNLTGSITKTYTKTDTFHGPQESSRYNSREYKVKFYNTKGTYTARMYSGLEGSAGMMYKDISGNWTEPLNHLAYSVDRIV